MKAEKIIAKMKSSNKGHRFEDCEKVLLSIGYNLDRIKGSHHTFVHVQSKQIITIAKHKPVSPNAIKDIIQAWEKHSSI